MVQQSRTNRREHDYNPRGLPRDYCSLTPHRHNPFTFHNSEVGQWLVTVKSTRQSEESLLENVSLVLSRNDVSRQMLAHAYRGNSCLLPFQFQPHLRNFSALRCFIVRGARSINAPGNVTIPRDENAILNLVCPSSERGIGFRVVYLTRSRKSWTNHLLFYRRLEYVPQGKPSRPG